MGCGIACVAMIAGVTYAEAKAAVRSRPNRTGNSTYYADLKWALGKFGVAYEMNGRRGFRFDGWTSINVRSIVAVECEPPRAGNWHWVVFDKVNSVGFVLDPRADKGIRRDLRSIRGKTYLKVVRSRP